MTGGWHPAPPAGWDDLCRDARDAGAIHRPELAIALAVTQPGFEAQWWAIESQGTLLGGMPVVVERRAGFHWIHALPLGLPGAPLSRDGAHAEVDRAAAAALEDLARERRAVGGGWVLYRPRGPAVEAAEKVSGETRMLESSLIELEDGVPRAWERVDREARAEIRHARRHGLRFAEDAEALEEAYTLYRAQSRAWAGHRPRPLELWRRLLLGGDSSPGRLFTVRDSGGLVAAALVLVGRHDALVWLSGVHVVARPRHAFGLLLWSVVEWCGARGIATLNLGGSAPGTGIASFKHALGALAYRHPVRWIGPAHAGVLGRGVARLYERARSRTRGEPA